LFEKFRRFVILVSIRSGWIDLSTLSSFAGPLHKAGHDFDARLGELIEKDGYYYLLKREAETNSHTHCPASLERRDGFFRTTKHSIGIFIADKSLLSLESTLNLAIQPTP